MHINIKSILYYYYYYYYYYYWYSALGPVWAETIVQSGDWYGSRTLHPGQVLRGSLPLLSPDIILYIISYYKRSKPPTCTILCHSYGHLEGDVI